MSLKIRPSEAKLRGRTLPTSILSKMEIHEERVLFEAWVEGHGWELECEWDPHTQSYLSETELLYSTFSPSFSPPICPVGTRVRMMWASWRDRAALAKTHPRNFIDPPSFSR